MLTQLKVKPSQVASLELNQVTMATLDHLALASLNLVPSLALFGFRFHDPAAGSEVVLCFLINGSFGFRICDHGDNSIVLDN